MSDKLVKDQPREMPSEEGPLAAYSGKRPPAPAWFEEAIAAPYEQLEIEVDGARIEVQRWGQVGKQGLMFVHGNGAHAHWWDFIAPFFAKDYCCAAMSFSGMGDSDWREKYDMNTFAKEVMAAIDAAGLNRGPDKPIVVAHSFGGFVTILAGADYGDQLAGTVIVDSPVNPPNRNRGGPPRSPRKNRVYPTLEKALARFRLAPPQPCENHYAMDYIARWSLKKAMDEETGEPGWTWKFDPSIWRRFEIDRSAADCLKETKCRIALFRGEQSSLMPDDVREYMTDLLNRQVAFVSIPQSRHHVMLDQPLAFVSALRTLLDEWRHSTSNRLS